jgi:hypothetical protein
VKSKYYSGRAKKGYVYDVLVNEVKTVDKDMNCDAVLNKLTAFL